MERLDDTRQMLCRECSTDIAERVVKRLPPGLKLPFLIKAASIVACCRRT